MTVLEGYKLKVDALTERLDDVSSVDCTDEVQRLIEEASDKLKDMMYIIVNLGTANGTMAAALKMMIDE